MKKWKDTLKRVTKTLPTSVKVCFILSMILQFVVFLIGEITVLQLVKFEALVVILYGSYVTIFHICRCFDEKKFLEYMELLTTTKD